MLHIMLPNLQLILFCVCFVIENFKKVLICRLAIDSIIVYHTIIISNTLNKVTDCIELRVVKGWLI